MEQNADNLQKITEYFIKGCTPKQEYKIGVEIEHFLLKEDDTNASYEEIMTFLHEVYGDKNMLGGMPEYLLSLEPAAQLEVSICPKHTVDELEQSYRKFVDTIMPYLEEKKWHMVTCGYQPHAKAEDLPLIPKERYRYMDKYFRESGSRGMQMMRGTAAVQVAIDYCDEADFRRKYQLAQILSPILALLTENSPIYEGEKNHRHILRTYIWQDVDTKRCGIVPGSMQDDFGFNDYAKYLWQMPLILAETEEGTQYVGDVTAQELYAERSMRKDEIEHLLSMVFPDVRLKNYIEIRMADSMPLHRTFAYCRMLYDIFYSERAMKELRDYFGNVREDDIREAQKQVIAYGYDAVVYHRSIRDVIEHLRKYSAAQQRIEE